MYTKKIIIVLKKNKLIIKKGCVTDAYELGLFQFKKL